MARNEMKFADGALAGHSRVQIEALRETTAARDTERAKASNERPRSIEVRSPDDLGALVRATRKALGVDQQYVADIAGVGRRFVSELENGKPTLEIGKVLAVTAALGIDLFAMKR